jgi:hypothetical protein
LGCISPFLIKGTHGFLVKVWFRSRTEEPRQVFTTNSHPVALPLQVASCKCSAMAYDINNHNKEMQVSSGMHLCIKM